MAYVLRPDAPDPVLSTGLAWNHVEPKPAKDGKSSGGGGWSRPVRGFRSSKER